MLHATGDTDESDTLYWSLDVTAQPKSTVACQLHCKFLDYPTFQIQLPAFDEKLPHRRKGKSCLFHTDARDWEHWWRSVQSSMFDMELQSTEGRVIHVVASISLQGPLKSSTKTAVLFDGPVTFIDMQDQPVITLAIRVQLRQINPPVKQPIIQESPIRSESTHTQIVYSPEPALEAVHEKVHEKVHEAVQTSPPRAATPTLERVPSPEINTVQVKPEHSSTPVKSKSPLQKSATQSPEKVIEIAVKHQNSNQFFSADERAMLLDLLYSRLSIDRRRFIESRRRQKLERQAAVAKLAKI